MGKKRAYLKPGTLVEIEFLDHAQGTNRDEGWAPVACRVAGYVFRDEPQFIILSAWISGKLSDDQSDHISIVKHAGMKIRRLRGGARLKEMGE